MKTTEINKLTDEQLVAELEKAFKEKFIFSMQKSIGQLNQTHLLRLNKKHIARLKTIQSMRKG